MKWHVALNVVVAAAIAVLLVVATDRGLALQCARLLGDLLLLVEERDRNGSSSKSETLMTLRQHCRSD